MDNGAAAERGTHDADAHAEVPGGTDLYGVTGEECACLLISEGALGRRIPLPFVSSSDRSPASSARSSVCVKASWIPPLALTELAMAIPESSIRKSMLAGVSTFQYENAEF